MPDLKLGVEDQYQLEALICLQCVHTQVLERVGEGAFSPAQGVLRETMNTLESNLEIESNHAPPTPGMSPIRRPEELTIIPYCF